MPDPSFQPQAAAAPGRRAPAMRTRPDANRADPQPDLRPVSPASVDLPLPAVDLPLALSAGERRLASRAVEAWAIGDTALLSLFAANTIAIDLASEPPVVRRAGRSIAGDFGLVAGMLLDEAAVAAGGLAGRLAQACRRLRITAQPTPFDADVRTPGGACLLARGVLLPSGPGEARAVVSWREELDAEASAALRRELLAADRGLPAR